MSNAYWKWWKCKLVLIVSWRESEQNLYQCVGNTSGFSHWWNLASCLRQIWVDARWICMVPLPIIWRNSYQRWILIGSLISFLIHQSRCERKSTASLRLRSDKMLTVQILCYKFTYVQDGEIYLNTTKTLIKKFAPVDIWRIGTFSTAFKMFSSLSYVIYRPLQFSSEFIISSNFILPSSSLEAVSSQIGWILMQFINSTSHCSTVVHEWNGYFDIALHRGITM